MTTPIQTPIHVLFIIDASGSMLSRTQDVRGGFNSYIDGLREDQTSTYRVSAVTFDTQVRSLFSDLPLDDVPALDATNYRAGGNTALYDAIGLAVNQLTNKVTLKGKVYGEDRVVVIIMTDGEENSSRSFTKSTIIGKIARRQEAGNWTFVYLGADQNAWAIAQTLGMYQGNTMAFDGTTTRSVFDNLVGQTVQYGASNTASSTSFTTGGGTVTTTAPTASTAANPAATLFGHSVFVASPDDAPPVTQDDIDAAKDDDGDEEGPKDDGE